MKSLITAVAALALVAGAAGRTRADVIPLFNTGVDAGGTPLTDGTIGDPHYSLIAVPGDATDIRVRTSTGGFPIPPWIGDDSVSAWIGPNNNNNLDGPIGSYDYQTTFDLTGLDPATASIIGRWSADNTGTDILINGVSTGNTAAGFSTWDNFAIGSNFVSGVNTLDFIVHNDGGATGVRVEMSGTATLRSVPEPSSIALAALGGVMALGYVRRKVRRVSA